MWKFIILAIFVITVLVCISSCIKSNKKYRKYKKYREYKKYKNSSNTKVNYSSLHNNYYQDLDKTEKDNSKYENLQNSSLTKTNSSNDFKLTEVQVYKSIYDCLLHNPKWLNCRQKILKRDNYKCQWCGSENNLQIHHKYYCKLPNNKLVNPWEYKEDCFMTLCKSCHEKWHEKHQNKVYYRSYGEQTEVLRYINRINKI